MRILDRYIVRQFVVSFLFGLLAFLIIFLVIDMMEKLDDFIDANVPTETIIEYYVAFTPEIIKLMTPVAMLLAALFVVGRLSGQNELPAMKSSGVSLYRILLPFVVVSFIVSVASVYLNGWILPAANQKKFYIERVYLRTSLEATSRANMFFQEGRTRIISVGFYDTQSKTATHVSIEDFSDTDLTVLTGRYDATQMQWKKAADSSSEQWVLSRGMRRIISEGRQLIEPFDQLPMGRLSISPSDIEKKQRKPDEMDYYELEEFIANQERAGQNVSRWLVDFHSKLSFPFASVIMVLFGVPFASARPRTGAAVGFGICIAVTFIYLAFMKTSQVFGYNGDLNPLFTAWLANIIFLFVGLVNLFRVQK
ncbi:MAG TPA: LPS export ABC transporter permease LptG [Bacteroidota bacterium]|nr:LPS export ABC transporter permease LptG [Bacteroidota bacterium]